MSEATGNIAWLRSWQSSLMMISSLSGDFCVWRRRASSLVVSVVVEESHITKGGGGEREREREKMRETDRDVDREREREQERDNL